MSAPPETPAPNLATRNLLDVSNIEVVYGGAILAVADVSLSVGAGEIVALLGANGAGKSTVLKAISGLAAARSRERPTGPCALRRPGHSRSTGQPSDLSGHRPRA